jgi:multidrug resistance efflux pump
MRARQIILVNVIIFIVLIAAVLGGVWYFYNRHNYITVNDAHVDANMSYVVGLTPGKLTTWNVSDGSTVSSGDVIGIEKLPTGQTMNITAPISGQIVQSAATVGEVVGQGTVLGAVADIHHEYVTAYVPETEIRNVSVGQTVDIYVDAYPGDSFSGSILSISSQSAAASSPLPTGSSTGSFTKTVQRIPIRISIDAKQGKYIIPQMNVTVRIHR